MTRRQWMWLWIWLLLFFIIFCVWNKLQIFTDESKEMSKHMPTTVKTVSQQKERVSSDSGNNKDINFKIIKDDGSIKISGVFSSKDELEKIKSKLNEISDNIEEGVIIIDENAKNNKISKLLLNISDDFSKFKSGYLEYADKKIIIDGIVDDESIKHAIADKALLAQNLYVENRIVVQKQTIEEEQVKKEISKEPTKEEIQAKLDDILKIKKVEFVYAKATLTKSGIKTVDEVYDLLTKYKDISIEIGGHTDSRGSAKINKELSQKRADTIKKYLISKGIDSDRLRAVGYGESRPLVKNNSSKNRQINRRVEFKIIGE